MFLENPRPLVILMADGVEMRRATITLLRHGLPETSGLDVEEDQASGEVLDCAGLQPSGIHGMLSSQLPRNSCDNSREFRF